MPPFTVILPPTQANTGLAWATRCGGVALIGIDSKTKQATAVGPAAGKME